ncbi:MAG: T9SS type A sorting domain-containing protein [Bacteroidota bacterium]|nr:T9SS type A sorting domain-containing protein [Bacteroidota bacterium]
MIFGYMHSKTKIVIIPKRKLFFAFFLFFSSILINAQNNGGFENWSVLYGNDEPDNWQTLNILSLFGTNPVSAFKVSGTDKYSGNYALKIVSNYFPTKVIGQLPDTFGYALNGKIIISPPSFISGVPYTSRPEKISFYAKYIPVGLDTGLIGVVLHRNTPTGRDTIAYNRNKILPNGSYTHYEININYRSNAIPDSADIYFKPSNTDSLARRVGSALFIDDVAFVDFVGISENENYSSKIKVYPNPASDQLSISIDIKEAEKIEITDALGRNISSIKVQNFEAKLNVVNYKNGNYYYKIIDKKNKPITYGKFVVQK